MPDIVAVVDGELLTQEMATRMPFRYGIARVTGLTHGYVRLRVRVGGREWTGVAADHLAPKWFTKNPDTSYEDDVAEMKRVIRQAIRFAEELGEAPSPFTLWRRLYDRQAAWGAAEGLAPLLTHFGVSLVERAVLDAFCRAVGRPFAALLREGTLGVELGDVHPELAGRTPAEFLPTAPLASVLARHTVGMADPLTEADIPDAERLHDGLPQSLAACIREYGLRHFKLKIGGEPAADAARLGRILCVIAENVPDAEWAFSLDGNESYRSLADLRAFWEAALREPEIAPHLAAGRLLFIEQPLHRDIALSPEAGDAFAEWPDRPPVVMDESDATLDSLPTALSRGYAGTSHKNCKGVFKGVANACLLSKRRAERAGTPLLLTGEDLSNVGPVALHQDLAVQAALGIGSVERNGQHYFAGLSLFPPAVQEATASAHADLYRDAGRGYPALAVRDGRVRLDSINAAPFGCLPAFDPRDWAEPEKGGRPV